jgi:putative Mg2+ transporter-C (MgtC) family protein
MPDIPIQGDIVIRLLVASVLGAAIGFEREVHEHAAGTRTHLLVALGSTTFTVLSIYGFADIPGSAQPDPTRIAAQIVTGIGFLGAGAIIHYGTLVRGLTTAASLWATAAIGLAVGAGDYLVAVVGTAIVIFSLGPLNFLVARFAPRGRRTLRIRLELSQLDALGDVSALLTKSSADMLGIQSRRLGEGRYEVDLDVRIPVRTKGQTIVAELSALPNTEVRESTEENE